MRVVLALKVRDEEDILEHNLRFHRAQGVDFFVVTDNGSTDRTPEILAGYERAGLARVIAEPDSEMHEKGHEWVTRMARVAASEHAADWVVHGDADEFWWPVAGTLREALAGIPPQYGALVAPRAEFVAVPDGPGSFAERLVVRERQALLRPKVAHRASPEAVVLHRGQHDVAFVPPGEDLRSALRPPGRAVLRGVRPEGGTGGGEPVWAPRFPVRILHFPVRSLEQFRRRVEAALLRDPGRGPRVRLRERYEEEGAAGLYGDLALDKPAIEAGIAAGRLVRDTRLRDYLARCPDPLADGEAAVIQPESLPEARLEVERSELERDAMEALARHARLNETRLDESRERLQELTAEVIDLRKMRAKAEHRRKRIERLQGKVKTLRRELREERQRPWSRLRAALDRRRH